MKFRARECPDMILRRPWRRWDDGFRRQKGDIVMPELVIDAREADLGGGFAVQRILPFRKRRMVGPFIFLDHAGPLHLPPDQLRNADVRPHPHIGLSTVSYLFDGGLMHRDSLGAEQAIRPGEVNWITAGRGIAHSERFDDPASQAGGAFEMIPSRVALPVARSEEEHTSALQSLMRISYAVFCLKTNNTNN